MAAKGGGGTDDFGPGGGHKSRPPGAGKGRAPGGGKGGGRIGDTDAGSVLQQLLNAMQPLPPANSPGTTKSSPPTIGNGAKAISSSGSASVELSEGNGRKKAKKKHTRRIQRPPQKKPAAKPKEVVRLTPEQKAAAIAIADAASGFRVGAPTQPTKHAPSVLTDFGEAGFRRIKAFRAALESFVADARAPLAVDDETYRETMDRIALGAASLDEMVAPSEGFIGCDFGTSTTKTVVRWPYEASTGYAIALPVPLAWRSGGVPHLWPTAIYFDRKAQLFSPQPRDGFEATTGFKSGLLEGRALRMCGGGAMTNADAAVAFLAQYLAYAVGTLRVRFPERKISTVNFGIPVAKLMDSTVANDFVRVINAAISLIGKAGHLTLADVRSALSQPTGSPLLATFHAELSGAIAGYCSSARHRRGPHMIIDCGSATLDIASFDLGDAQWPIGIYAAQVEPLGADACVRYISAGASEKDCRDAARFQEAQVCSQSLRENRVGFQLQLNGQFNYQVILVGGGIDSDIHKPLLERMEAAFSFKFHRPKFDTPLSRERQSDDARLVLASGLARDPIDLRALAMPADKPRDDWNGPDMVSKDQV